MPTSFLEIVELPDKVFLQGQHVEVAKAMLSVGVQMAGRLAEGEPEKEEGPRVLH